MSHLNEYQQFISRIFTKTEKWRKTIGFTKIAKEKILSMKRILFVFRQMKHRIVSITILF